MALPISIAEATSIWQRKYGENEKKRLTRRVTDDDINEIVKKLKMEVDDL